MRTYSRRFINEAGEAIDIRVNEETRHGEEEIYLYLAGTESERELTVSPKEAAELVEGLSRVLGYRR